MFNRRLLPSISTITSLIITRPMVTTATAGGIQECRYPSAGVDVGVEDIMEGVDITGAAEGTVVITAVVIIKTTA